MKKGDILSGKVPNRYPELFIKAEVMRMKRNTATVYCGENGQVSYCNILPDDTVKVFTSYGYIVMGVDNK